MPRPPTFDIGDPVRIRNVFYDFESRTKVDPPIVTAKIKHEDDTSPTDISAGIDHPSEGTFEVTYVVTKSGTYWWQMKGDGVDTKEDRFFVRPSHLD